MATGTGNLSGLGKHFSDENAARELLTQMRWPNGVACPRCGGADPYTLKPKASGKNPARQGLYKCRACRQQFSTTTGTIFESSHVPVSKWLLALHLICASKKGMSALQLQRMLGITYRAAWFVMHRLRCAMAERDGIFTKLTGVVEMDETYIGGRRRSNTVKQPKIPVVALVQRTGRVVARPMETVNVNNIGRLIEERVSHNATLMTDEAAVYRSFTDDAGMKHHAVNHRRDEYVRGNVHSNSVEGFFSLLKRGINGTFHHVSKGHLSRYVDEFSFRYNTRQALGYNDSDRAALLVLGAEGKRLTYKKGTRASAA